MVDNSEYRAARRTILQNEIHARYMYWAQQWDGSFDDSGQRWIEQMLASDPIARRLHEELENLGKA